MFENVGWEKILLLLVVGLFVLGPERLPEAAAWLGRSIRQVKDFASGAREQLRQELGPELEELRKPVDELRGPLQELRGLRNLDPRRAMISTLFDDDQSGLKPNGFVPPPGGTAAWGGAASGALGIAGAVQAALFAEPSPRPLTPGERPPIDPDAT